MIVALPDDACARDNSQLLPATVAAYSYIFWMTSGIPFDLDGGPIRLQHLCAAARDAVFAQIEDSDALETALTAYYCETYTQFAVYFAEFSGLHEGSAVSTAIGVGV